MNQCFVAKLCKIIALAMSRSICTATCTATGANPTNQPAEQVYKNIHVLKGIPSAELIPTMQFIAASLGVECSYCHVQSAFEKDDKKPKQTARKMIQMLFAIDNQNFDSGKKVTCYTCHRGSTKPLAIPPVATDWSKLDVPASVREPEPHSILSTAQIIDKYIEALGGSTAVETVSSRVQTGSVSISGGPKLPIKIFTKSAGKQISIMRVPNGESVTALDGVSGWMSAPGRPMIEMSASEVEGARLDADLHLALHLKSLFLELRTERTETIGDQPANLVLVLHEGDVPVELYFDQRSGLLVRIVRYVQTALGSLPVQVDYADYRDVSGVKVPFRWTLSRSGVWFAIEIDRVEQNVQIDDSTFVKPREPSDERQETNHPKTGSSASP